VPRAVATDAESARDVLAEALARGEARPPRRLGVAVAPSYVARRLRRAVGLPEQDGVLVRAVSEGSAAERAGIARGDLIVAAGGVEVTSIDELYRALDAVGPDDSLEVKLLRATEERTVNVSFDATREEAAR
jgi:serine protease Do